jgi:hypothetical protein
VLESSEYRLEPFGELSGGFGRRQVVLRFHDSW